MTEELQPTSPRDPWPEQLRRGHETRDASIRGVIYCAIGFIVTGGVLHLLLWLFFSHMATQPRPVDLPLSAVTDSTHLPPAPPLQPRPEHDQLPRMDLADMHRREDAVFMQLGWPVDPNTHHRTVPAAVLQAVAKRRPPATAPSSAAPATQQTVTPIPGVDQGAPQLRGKEAGDAVQ